MTPSTVREAAIIPTSPMGENRQPGPLFTLHGSSATLAETGQAVLRALVSAAKGELRAAKARRGSEAADAAEVAEASLTPSQVRRGACEPAPGTDTCSRALRDTLVGT